MALSVVAFSEQPWYLEVGESLETLKRRSDQSTTARQPVTLEVDDLKPSTEYVYRLRARGDGLTPESPVGVRRFRTWRRPGEAFVFTLSTDSHIHYNKARNPEHPSFRTQKLVCDDEPDFHVTLGDEAMTHHQSALAVQPELAARSYLHYRKHYRRIFEQAPIYFGIGNHEGEGWIGESHGFSRQLAKCSREARQLFVPNPDDRTYSQGGTTGGSYFAWSWSDALFIMLDPYTHSPTNPARPDAWTLGPEQMQWFEGVLENSTERWKILFQHQLVGAAPFSQKFGPHGMYPNYGRGGALFAGVGEQARIQELMKRHGGQIIFKGHDHVFVDELEDGVHYTTAGRLSSREVDGEPPWGKLETFKALYPNGYLAVSGHVRTAVSPEKVEVSFVDSDGAVRGAYTVLPT